MKLPYYLLILTFITLLPVFCANASEPSEPMHTFKGSDEISFINVYVVYYLPKDAKPLPDWQERIQYHINRIEKFHQREFGKQSILQCTLWNDPVIASATRGGFNQKDVNRFFFDSMDEIRLAGKLPTGDEAFPILLVMADMNFCPGYDDWTRECSPDQCICQNHDNCSGHVTGDGEDRPGTCCGGSRAIYWPAQQLGLGLVTADGWRVPMKGTDCVVYHEGVGHSIGLPHPDPGNHSVMSMAQYVDYINKSWIDEDQKLAMGWQKEPIDSNDLFSTFTVKHQPIKPKANEPVELIVELPAKFEISSVTAEYQLDLWQPFETLGESLTLIEDGITKIKWQLPKLPTSKSLAYKVKLTTTSGENEELWGYYKIRE